MTLEDLRQQRDQDTERRVLHAARELQGQTRAQTDRYTLTRTHNTHTHTANVPSAGLRLSVARCPRVPLRALEPFARAIFMSSPDVNYDQDVQNLTDSRPEPE